MPLTIAHPAAVLPFRYRRVPMSALVIGSIAPDFEYFLHLYPHSDFSHTIVGLFAFCLPAGLLALWIFHRIWKRPLMAMSEMAPAEPPGVFRFLPLSRFFWVCCGLLIGSVMHLIWDSFTHHYGWLVQRSEALQKHVYLLGRFSFLRYLILQQISTVLGLGILLCVALHHRTWLWRTVKHRWPLIVVAGWIAVAGGIALGMLVAGDVSTREGLMRWLGCAFVVGSLILSLVITFFSLLWHLNHHRPGSLF